MALSNDYSLKFRKSNGVVETYYGYTSKVTTPSLTFRSSNGNVRYIPLTTSYSSSPLKVRYNNSIYGIARQSCTITVNCNIVATADPQVYPTNWNCVLYVNNITLNNGGFSFPTSLTVYIINGKSLSFNIPAYTTSSSGSNISYYVGSWEVGSGSEFWIESTLQNLYFNINILGSNYASNNYTIGGDHSYGCLSGNYTLTYTFYL